MKKGSITFCVLLGLFVWCYDSCWSSVWGTYVYDKTGKKCLTVICNINDSTTYNGKVYRRGLYLTPQKLRRGFPDSNYIRLDYIGAIFPLYYKWKNDTLYLRVGEWRVLENHLSDKSVLDTVVLNYEKWGINGHDSLNHWEDYLEWKKMREEYDFFYSDDL